MTRKSTNNSTFAIVPVSFLAVSFAVTENLVQRTNSYVKKNLLSKIFKT